MRIHHGPSEASCHYAAAYVAHHSVCDLRAALRIYHDIVSSYPNELESSYSRIQIQSIIDAVVPERELLDLQTTLALIHLDRQETLGVAPIPALQLVAGPSL